MALFVARIIIFLRMNAEKLSTRPKKRSFLKCLVLLSDLRKVCLNNIFSAPLVGISLLINLRILIRLIVYGPIELLSSRVEKREKKITMNNFEISETRNVKRRLVEFNAHVTY